MQLLWNKLRDELAIQTTAITENISSMIDEKLKPLTEENIALKKEVNELKSKIQGMDRETRKNNLILHGLPETEENNTQLMETVLSTLNTVSNATEMDNWDRWEVSRAHRLGKKNEKSSRPILISLTLIWRRAELLKNKKNLPKNIYITEDLPREVLNRRKELRNKLIEERNKGKIAYFKFDQLIVKDKTVDKRKRSPSNSPQTSSQKENEVQKMPTKINKVDALSKLDAGRLRSISFSGQN